MTLNSKVTGPEAGLGYTLSSIFACVASVFTGSKTSEMIPAFRLVPTVITPDLGSLIPQLLDALTESEPEVAVPEKLIKAGFEFDFPEIEKALTYLF